MSEKAPWPHSCATTHMPVQTVPVNAAYASHTGAHTAFRGINAPTATQAADCATEMAAYINDLAVSRSKQCLGTACRTCALVGMSDFSTSMALPCSPLSSGRSNLSFMSDATSGSNAIIRAGALALLRCTTRDCRSSGEWCSPRLDGARSNARMVMEVARGKPSFAFDGDLG